MKIADISGAPCHLHAHFSDRFWAFSLRLAVDLFPDMELPVAVVMTTYEGAAPAEVEKLVTKPIESAVSTVSNIDEIQSISKMEAPWSS